MPFVLTADPTLLAGEGCTAPEEHRSAVRVFRADDADWNRCLSMLGLGDDNRHLGDWTTLER